MHAIEKILAEAAGKEFVATGEIVNCRVDLAEVNDLYLQTIRSFYEMGGKKVYDPRKITFMLDHYAPASTVQQAENQKQMREFCQEQGIELLFDVDQGVCHQVMVDHGLFTPAWCWWPRIPIRPPTGLAEPSEQAWGQRTWR